jgi:ADP-ribosylglycohydrolase
LIKCFYIQCEKIFEFMKKVVVMALILISCTDKKTADSKFPVPEWPAKTQRVAWGAGMSKEIYADKILGLLVGSAIGDAMGAPTEMWHHSYIKQQIGYVDSLDVHIRTASAEGPWASYMPAGGTTDDTRWKYLTGQYLLTQSARPDSLNAKDFGQHIIKQYLSDIADLKATGTF